MSKQTVIVSGGMVEKDFALSILKSEETEFVIGVDRGLVFLYDNEINPIISWEILTAFRGSSLNITEKNLMCP